VSGDLPVFRTGTAHRVELPEIAGVIAGIFRIAAEI